MTREKKKTDHAFPELKRLLRSRLIRLVAPKAAVDFFAGEGRILAGLYGGFAAVHAVEKDPAKLARLLARAREQAAANRPGPALTAYAMDNRDFVRAILPGLADVTFMDFDAYGNPHPLIAQAFAHHRVRERTAVAVTDGGRMALLRGQRITPAAYQVAAPDHRLARTRSLSASEYELLVRGFWKELAKKYGLTASYFTASWAKGRRVMYYGLIIAPARDRMDQRGPLGSEPVEPEPARAGQAP
ncbi:MAG TPA: hypothetical protein VM658_14515 [bacterium]|nr:hypothetical protein [bacterium]